MKKTFTKKTLVAGIAAALMTLTATNVNAKETFIYGWDAEQMTWTPAYLLTWRTEGPTLQKLSENK